MRISLTARSTSTLVPAFGLVIVASGAGLGPGFHGPDKPAAVVLRDSCVATAHLNGRQEVPPRDTRAAGEFSLRIEGERATYKLIVANIANVVKAHVHVGPPDSAGAAVVLLDSLPRAGMGAFNGVLKEGSFTAADFIKDFAGKPWDVFAQALARGRLYVNVHTNDGVFPIDTGPGDFGPMGEIRGPLRIVGHCR